MNVMIEDGNIVGYKVNLEVTFVLEEYFGWHYRSRQRPAGDRDPHAGSGPLTLGSDGSHGTRPKPKT
jgi:hypothetical protein